ncbi:MAG: Ig-like domain-containing protein [Sandaracinus sp.]|nr:Ig-like domain-containing protein [Sandaracinus sp.]
MRDARWMAVLGLLGVLACGDDDARPEADAGIDAMSVMPDGGADAGAPDDGGLDGGRRDEDGGSDGGVVPSGRLATLIEEAADAICAGLVRCCDDAAMAQFFGPIASAESFESFRPRIPPMATLTEEECGDVLTEIYAIRPFGDWVDAAARGDVTFVESELDACLSELEEAECGAEMASRLFDGECLAFVAPNGGASQRRVFERTGTEGDGCAPISDGLGAGFYGTCDPTQAFCCYRMPGSEDCGFPVAGTVGTCAAASGEGERCTYGSLPLQLCETGLYCNDMGRCEAEATAPLENGDTCATAGFDILGQCTDGYCDLLGTRQCRARKANGDSCSGAEECSGGECSGTPRVCRTSTFCAGEVVAVTVAVMPDEVTLEAGATQTFTATVMGAADTSVTWSASAGTIDAAGNFTAPAEAGSVTVTATSVEDTSVSATATVTVTVTSSGAWTVSTLAGAAMPGTNDGTGDAARFNSPAGLALDTDGTLLVSDSGSARIRRVTAAGVVSTVFAGAPLSTPWGLAVASDGAIWVADRGANAIFRIVGASIERIAGSATNASGYADGTGSSVRFNAPRGMTRDGDTFLVADANNHSIRRVTAAGEVTTILGDGGFGTTFTDGPVASARAYYPFLVFVASDGIYVGGQDHCLRRIAEGMFTRVAGQCGNVLNNGRMNGDALTEARFDNPRGLAATAGGSLLVVESSNNLVRELSADRSTVSTFAGTLSAGGTPVAGFMDGDATSEARFSGPIAAVVLADGSVVVADYGNNRLRRVAP